MRTIEVFSGQRFWIRLDYRREDGILEGKRKKVESRRSKVEGCLCEAGGRGNLSGLEGVLGLVGLMGLVGLVGLVEGHGAGHRVSGACTRPA